MPLIHHVKHEVNISLLQVFRVRIPRLETPGRPPAERNQWDRWCSAQSLDRLICCSWRWVVCWLSYFNLQETWFFFPTLDMAMYRKWTDSSWTEHEFLDVYLDKDGLTILHSLTQDSSDHPSGTPDCISTKERAVLTPLISQLHLTSFRELDEFSATRGGNKSNFIPAWAKAKWLGRGYT